MIAPPEYIDAPKAGRDANTAPPTAIAWRTDSAKRGVVRDSRVVRIGSIDAVRGAAMILVCLAHFTGVYLWNENARDSVNYLGVITKVASPTFVIVSGMVVGFLAVTSPAHFGALRIKLLDRGVFLLLVGHLLLTLAIAPSLDAFGRAYRTSFITDAIAIAVIVGPTLVRCLRPAVRLFLGVGIFAMDWVAVGVWLPTAPLLVMAKRYLVGTGAGVSGEAAPIFAVIPWFAVYLMASALGERVGKMYAAGDRRGADHQLARIGGSCLLIGLVLHAATMLVRHFEPWLLPPDSSLLMFFSIYQKYPPGPVYLAFYGGAGIVMLATILEIDTQRRFAQVMDQLRRIGRASLFTFIAQYALYVSVLERLALPYNPYWPLMFAASVVILAAGAGWWDRRDGNRFLTVGIAALVRAREARRDPVRVSARAWPLHPVHPAPRMSAGGRP